MNEPIPVLIESEAWLKDGNNYMNIEGKYKTSFPDDCFIARGTGKANKNLLAQRGIELEYDGDGLPVACFLELRDSGKFRPSNRGAIKEFYRFTKARVGDTILFTQVSPRKFKVGLVRTSKTNSSATAA